MPTKVPDSPTVPPVNPSLIDRFKHTFNEFWRLRWIIVFAVTVIVLRDLGVLPNESALTLMVYKPALACIGMTFAHLAYSQCFYYIDMSKLFADGEYQALLGVCILRGLIYLAFILGVTLGL